mmetsp:Transcript_76733/g.193048  ORF Transcript_76733/g.193048 Transcript_76733/m.193048 type:complete len:261 (-) Transcript_76733:209-991(-)
MRELLPQDAECLPILLAEPAARRPRDEEQSARLRHGEGILDVAMASRLPIREVGALRNPLAPGLASRDGALDGHRVALHVHRLEGHILPAARHRLHRVGGVDLHPEPLSPVRPRRVLYRIEPSLQLLGVWVRGVPVELRRALAGYLLRCFVDPLHLSHQLFPRQLRAPPHLLLELVQQVFHPTALGGRLGRRGVRGRCICLLFSDHIGHPALFCFLRSLLAVLLNQRSAAIARIALEHFCEQLFNDGLATMLVIITSCIW